MAANAYYSSLPGEHAHERYSGNAYNSRPHHSFSSSQTGLKPLAMTNFDELEHVQRQDEALKQRIRGLKIAGRILATIISLAAFVPITMTLYKFLSTKNIYREAPKPGGGTINRNAWALETKTWPTYMYFGTATVSLLLNAGSLLGYAWNHKTSNTLSTMSSVFQWGELLINLAVWAVVAAIYRYEKNVVEDGKHNDLWGWTCSGPAQAIQSTFKDVVPFDRYCNIQSASWYAGIVQVGALILSAVTYYFAYRRRGSKRDVRSSVQRSLVGREGYRHQ